MIMAIIQALIILHFVLLIPGLLDVLGGQDQDLEGLLPQSQAQDNLWLECIFLETIGYCHLVVMGKYGYFIVLCII